VGSPYVRTFIGDYKAPLTEDEVAKNAAEYLDACGREAEAKGVTILIETHDSFNTGAKVKKIINKVSGNGVGVLWDMHHPYLAGETPEETYKLLGDRILHTHFKDDKEGKLCLMGQGSLPIKEVVDVLKKNDYKGYLSFEWEKMWVPELEDPEVAFPQYKDYMSKI